MESPPPLARYIAQQSKKRMFPGSSSSYVDQEVVEISPPVAWSSKSKSPKQKEIIHHEVIDIDMDEDSRDIMLIDEKVDTCNKGKEALANFSHSHSYSSKAEPVDGVQSSKKSSGPGMDNFLYQNGFTTDFSHGYDEFMDTCHGNLTYDDEYEFLQAHFDSIDIPPGVEAPIPWFSGPPQNEKNPATLSSSNHPCFPNSLDSSRTDSSHSWGLTELPKTGKTSASLISSNLKTRMNTRSQPQWVPVPPSSSYPESAHNKKKSAASTSSTYLNSQIERVAGNYPARFKSGSSLVYSSSKKKLSPSGSTSNYAPNSRLDAMQLSSGMESSYWGPFLRSRRKKPVDNGDVIDSKFPSMDAKSLPPAVDAYMSGWQTWDVFLDKQSLMSGDIHDSSDGVFTSGKVIYPPWVQDLANSQKSETDAGSSTVPSVFTSGKVIYSPCGPDLLANSQKSETDAGSSTVPPGPESLTERHVNDDDILNKFRLFKQFDIVQDHSDHHHSSKGSSSKQPSKNWAKKIQDEWRILEKDLPDTIFVRVYESRMDLLRAVIVGAEGTPYHDGLFFFDVFFPSGYPNVPPLVYYHSGGLRINPNLYNCGKVCLSLLNTWSGSSNEKWIPGVSTMLQVLVSIQALILNEKPYFNEPGYARMSGSLSGENSSQQYNESTLILSLKTMVYTMRNPPKHFEDFVLGHFHKHAQDILSACKAYIEGVQVGCLARGGVQDVDAGNNSCSQHFKDTLAGFITVLVQTFTQIGVKDCEKFLSLAEKGSNPVPNSGHMFLNYF